MKNKVSDGKTMDFTTAGAVTSGQALLIGVCIGVAICAAAGAGEVIATEIEGVFELPKVSTDVIAQGVPLTWDVSESKFTVAASAVGDCVGCAVAVEAAGNGTTTVLAKLLPGNGVLDDTV